MMTANDVLAIKALQIAHPSDWAATSEYYEITEKYGPFVDDLQRITFVIDSINQVQTDPSS